MIVTRFAPSPTGYLHIGGARTALFNWLYARHNNGKFLLRIEDTDRERSTPESIDAIHKSMKWLSLDADGEVIYQFSQAARHREVAEHLVSIGKAYRCYCTQEEVQHMREEARLNNKPMRYNGKCRDAEPQDIPYVVRFKAPQDGTTTIDDLVQGTVTVANDQLDDMVMLRADGTPTYMLSVVVDDHDMGITHIIRGDDHLNNAFRQYHLYIAMGWDTPHFAHIPLIHGEDGAKLSKRHGALGTHEYEHMGILSEAINNYLLRLGWSHGDDEIISTEQAIEWFNLESIGKSPARFDMQKLLNLNGYYIRESDNLRLVELTIPFMNKDLTPDEKDTLLRAMPGLKSRAKTLTELAENAEFYFADLPLDIKDDAKKVLDEQAKAQIKLFMSHLETQSEWSEKGLEESARAFAEVNEIKLGKLAQPLRAALTGQLVSPSVFDVMAVLGKEQSFKRLMDAC